MILVWAILFDAVLTSHLNHRLVCLGTGVLEENLVHSDGGTYLLSKQCLWDGIWIVEGMHDILCLVDHGCDYLIVAASGGVNGDSSVEVEIFFTLLVVHVLILCGLAKKIHSLVGLDHVLVYFILDILCG